MELLKESTKKVRIITKNPYFKYDSEDNVIGFNKQVFLEDLPSSKLNKLKKHYRIPKTYIKYCTIKELLKKDDLEEQIIKLITENRKLLSEEDEKYLRGKGYL